MTEILETLRAVNVALCVLTVLALLVRVNDRWHGLTVGGKLSAAGVIAFPAVLTYGSTVRYLRHVPPDIAVAGVTVACILVIVGQFVSRNDADRTGR